MPEGNGRAPGRFARWLSSDSVVTMIVLSVAGMVAFVRLESDLRHLESSFGTVAAQIEEQDDRAVDLAVLEAEIAHIRETLDMLAREIEALRR